MQKQQDSFLDLLILAIALGGNIIALFYQYYFKELPCPLCLLQRTGLFLVAYGAAMNLKFGRNIKYIFIIVVSSLYSLVVATRQVLLHIMPGDPGYGSTFLKLHFYTWNDIISFSFIVLVSVAPLFKKISLDNILSKMPLSKKNVVDISFSVLLLLLIINTISVYLECGFDQCPDNPTEYKKLTISGKSMESQSC